MKVVKFIIENYKAIRGRKEFTPEGSSFFLVGGNAQGKTSAGRAIMDILQKALPSKPVTDGEKEGFLEFEFDTGHKLFAKLSENGRSKIEFITQDGINVGGPKELLQKLLGQTFSIDEFLKMAPKPRREMLEKITGVDLTDLNEQEKEAMEERRIIKRQYADQQARVEPYDKDLLKKDPVKVEDLSLELNALNLARANRENVIDAANNADTRISEIKAEINALRQKMDVLVDENKKRDTWLRENPEQGTERIEELKTEINSASETNKKIQDAQRFHNEFLRAEILEKRVQEFENKIKDIREAKEKALSENPLPATGLVWSEDGETLLLDGLPFESGQIASSRKVIAGLQIAESMMGQIRYIHFDASILDKKSAGEILQWAETKGLQLCLERAEWDGGEMKFEVIDKTAINELVEAV